MNDHFARVTPIVGTHLHAKQIAMHGTLLAEPLIDYLAASGIGHWLLDVPLADCDRIAQRLYARHGSALNIEIQPWNLAAAPDVCIQIGTPRTQFKGAYFWIEPPTPTQACHVTYSPTIPLEATYTEIDPLRWSRAMPLIARLIRAFLLRDTTFASPEWTYLWEQPGSVYAVEHPLMPGNVEKAQTAPVWDTYQPIYSCQGTILIVGVGSLGSEAALHLAPHADHLILADSDVVETANPVRQAFTQADIGQFKVDALAATIKHKTACRVTTIPTELDAASLTSLLQTTSINTALIVTGTASDYELAEVLHTAHIPHLVGRCYPRAHYWEAILVDPQLRTPTFEAMRGHIQPGPAPAPTPEQQAAYSDAGALEAEPATLIESGWAAVWLANLIRELCLPCGLRSRYLLEWIQQGATCLIGGISVEQTPDGAAYAVHNPGEVRAWTQATIRGTHASALPNLPNRPYEWMEES